MNRLIRLALYGVNEALKTVRCLTDAVTTRRYCDGFSDGLTYPCGHRDCPRRAK